MGLVDQPLFSNPQSSAARELARLRATRVELRRQHRDAITAHNRSLAEMTDAQRVFQTAENRAFAKLEKDPGVVKQAKMRQAKTEKEARAASALEAQLAGAVKEVENEMLALAREHESDLIAEACDLHEEAAQEAEAIRRAAQRVTAKLNEATVAAMTVTSSVGNRALNQTIRDQLTVQQVITDGPPGLFRTAPGREASA
jgi:hypothetical protein